MRTANEEQFKRILSADLSEGVFFVCGNEAYLKKHYCSKLIEVFNDGTGFNLQEFGSSSDLQQLYDAVCQLPFMSDKKCVSLCDYDIESADEKSLNYLNEAIDSVGSHCVLLIWYNTMDADLSRPKTKKIAEHIESVGGVICKLDKKEANEIAKILCNGAAKRGCRMDVPTARYMMDQCGDDLTNLVSELDKLCSYAGNGVTITNAHIDNVCVRTIDVKAYNLGSAILAGKTNEAIALLDDLFYMNFDPVIIFGAISSPFIDMCRAVIRKDRSISEVASDFSYGRRDFVLKNAANIAKRIGKDKLNQCFELLNKCDSAIKSSSSPVRIALEQLTISLCKVMSEGN